MSTKYSFLTQLRAALPIMTSFAVIDLSRYAFESLRSDEDFNLYRGRGAGEPSSVGREDVGPSSILVLRPVSQEPELGTIKRLEHEYSLRDKLDPEWAVRPVRLTRHWDRIVLVLEDPGGRPLDQLLRNGSPARQEPCQKTPLQKGWLELNKIIGEIIAMAHGELKRNGVLLRTRLATDLPLIMGDRIQLQQVMLNLVINAIEALSGVSEGPRELLVSSAKVAVLAGHSGQETSEAEVEWPRALVSVADSGPGLDPNALDHLFDAFYTTKPQGLGMGLAISRSILEAHGGRLWATANVPKGAWFQFTLPIHNE